MKRLAPIAFALALLGAPLVTSAQTLVNGAQINRVWPNTNNGGQSGLAIIGGTYSGSNLFATKSVTGRDLFAVRFGGGGLTDCDTAGSSKLLYDAATKQFSCGTDQTGGSGGNWSNTGSLQSAFDARYLNVAGDTATGSITVRGHLSGATLFVSTAFSGAGLTDCDASTQKLQWDASLDRFTCGTDQDTVLTAGQGLSKAGTTLSVNAALSGSLAAFQTLSGATVKARNMLASSGALTWEGAASGATLYLGGKLEGAGLTDCDLASQTLAWDATTGRFGCGTDSDTTYTAGQNLALNGTAFSLSTTITGALLEFTTVSGATVYGTNSVRSSGSLVWEGAASGASLWVSTLDGAGLADCDIAGTSKLLWDATLKRFSCGTDQNTTAWSNTGALQARFDGRYVNTSGDTMTGALTINVTGGGNSTLGLNVLNTISGSMIRAQKALASSGTLTVRGTMIGTGSTLTLSRLGNSTYSTIQHLMNFGLSAGASSGGILTKSSNTLTVGAGNGFVKATDSDVADLRFFNWTGSSSAIPSGVTRYVGVSYNAGAPKVVQKTTDTWDLDTEFPLGTVINEGGTLYVMQNPWMTGEVETDIIERLDGKETILRDGRVGGLILANTGTRNVSVSTGQLLARVSEYPVNALNTAVSGSFDAYYRDGASGFTKQASQTQYTNTSYDDGDGTLGTIPVSSYASMWFYVMTDGSVAMQYGRATYGSLANALNDPVPSSAPDRISKQGILIGRFIIQRAASSPSSTQSAFGTAFTAATVEDHGDLAGLTDDDHTQYVLASGLRALTGNWEAGAFTIDSAALSGALVRAQRTLASSGTLVVEGAMSGASLFLGTKLEGAGLTDCDTAGSSKLLYDVTSGRFSCGTDQTGASVGAWSNTGSLQAYFDPRWVNTAGDSMTGALTLNITGGNRNTVGLKVVNFASGANLHAEGAITSSGTLSISDRFGNKYLSVDAIAGTVSFDGSDVDITAGGLNVMGGDIDLSGGDLINSGGRTILYGNNVTIGANATASTALEVIGTASGTRVYAEKTLASSGSLVWEGAASGASLFVGTSLRGVGLVDCDTAGTSKLLWDTTTGRFSCGTDTDTDTNTTYTAGQGLQLNSTSFRLLSTFSGAVIKATTTLASSGTIVAEGTISGSTLVGGTVSGSMLRYGSMGVFKRQVEVFSSGSTITTGSGKMMLTLADATISGAYLKAVHLSVQTAGTTNTTSLQIRNAMKGNRKMLSTVVSIDSAEKGSDTAAAAYVIDATNRSVGAYDQLIFDIPAVSTTAPKGSMQLYLEFYKP